MSGLNPYISPQPNLEYTRAIQAQANGINDGQRVLPVIVGRSERLAEVYRADYEQRAAQPNFNKTRPISRARTPPLAAAATEMMATSRAPTPKAAKADDGVNYEQHYYDPKQPPIRTRFDRNSTLQQQFFTDGVGQFVSDNGKANAELYFKSVRPLVARLRTHYPSATTAPGYQFYCY